MHLPIPAFTRSLSTLPKSNNSEPRIRTAPTSRATALLRSVDGVPTSVRAIANQSGLHLYVYLNFQIPGRPRACCEHSMHRITAQYRTGQITNSCAVEFTYSTSNLHRLSSSIVRSNFYRCRITPSMQALVKPIALPQLPKWVQRKQVHTSYIMINGVTPVSACSRRRLQMASYIA